MLTRQALHKKIERYWNGGRVLRAWMGQEPGLFPLHIGVGRPTARALVDDFSRLRDWKRALEQGSSADDYRIEYREINHRQLGSQKLPAQLLFDTPDAVVSYLGKHRAFERFKQLHGLIVERQPALQPWLHAHPMKALEQGEHWESLLTVIAYFQSHPRPNRYLRELSISAVDSKFIEARKGLIAQLLDHALPPEAIDLRVTGLSRHGFERRYGLKYDQPLIRFRLLDRVVAGTFGGIDDISLPLAQFHRLDPPVSRVFITENKINGLSFPEVPGSMVIFGLGYGIAALQSIPWLQRCEIQYWGDIDTHGFAMLSQLRGYYPQARSLLMDRETLQSQPQAWVVEEGKRMVARLQNLTDAEQACYRLLCDDTLGNNIRLEQERVPFERLINALSQDNFAQL